VLPATVVIDVGETIAILLSVVTLVLLGNACKQAREQFILEQTQRDAAVNALRGEMEAMRAGQARALSEESTRMAASVNRQATALEGSCADLANRLDAQDKCLLEMGARIDGVNTLYDQVQADVGRLRADTQMLCGAMRRKCQAAEPARAETRQSP
jgi:hypothetical protein